MTTSAAIESSSAIRIWRKFNTKKKKKKLAHGRRTDLFGALNRALSTSVDIQCITANLVLLAHKWTCIRNLHSAVVGRLFGTSTKLKSLEFGRGRFTSACLPFEFVVQECDDLTNRKEV